jgi:glucose-6-phosphate dehydrogenase assembly protein OpcA
MAGQVWSERDTTPSAIEGALRQLITEQCARHDAYAPARVLNLVVVVDREWRGEIMNRLDRVGRYHPSRTILCAVEEGRTTIDATVAITAIDDPKPGELALTRERVVLDVGTRYLHKLDTLVDPLVVSDIATVVWSPHGHSEAVDALLHLTQVVLVDSVNEPDSAAAIARARELAGEAYVVDLAWLRSTPWRERVASTFDPAAWRDELGRIDSVKVRHQS